MATDEKFLNLYYYLRNFGAAFIRFPLRCLCKKNYYKIIHSNSRFKNLHEGERCFILGNGPSIKKEDLTCLKNEYVFVVNQCTRLPFIQEINPNYYICIDNTFFNIDENKPEDRELLDTFIKLKDLSPELECFFPIEEKAHFVEKFGLDKLLNINYFQRGLSFHGKYKRDINYAGPVAGFGTVVHNAITLAIYMGFKEIYLLGCDNTGIVVTIKTALNTVSDSEYAYSVSENEKKRMSKMIEGKFEEYCKAYYYTVRDYRWLDGYCKKKGVELVNLSSETVIDSVKRSRLEKVF